MWERRAFLRAAGAGFVASLMPRCAEALERAELVFASNVQRRTGGFAAALVTGGGDLISTVALPGRGHDITSSPVTGQAVAFARQPGTFAVVFDRAGDRPPITLTSIAGRHFFGHGAFSPDGRLLYATENDFDVPRGVIGIYDATDGFRRIGEFDTYGIGPHEVLLTADGSLFAIANGGIETHPDYGRSELNIATMQPSLAFVDARNGELVGLLTLESGLHQLSIRHLAFDAAGRVWFGCQYRGDQADLPQLVGYATRDGAIKLIELPEDRLRGLRNYVGSLAATADGSLIGVSSPTGNSILAIDPVTATVVDSLSLLDGCGIAPDRRGLVATSGKGRMQGLAGSAIPPTEFDLNFDAHIRVLGA